jgi:hypothetical protein
MKTDTALVRAYGAVILNAEAAVHNHSTRVVNPGNAEFDNALGLDEHFKHTRTYKLGGAFYNRFKRFKNLSYRLVKFAFTGIAALDRFHKTFKVFGFEHKITSKYQNLIYAYYTTKLY